MSISPIKVSERKEISYLKELLHDILYDSQDASYVLKEYEDDIKFSLALNYLNITYQSYLEFNRIYRNLGAEHSDIENFLENYLDFKVELKMVITYKNDDIGSVDARIEELEHWERYARELLEKWMNTENN